MSLLEYKHNKYSQNGEDGILKEIFLRIGEGNKVCVEFGAWDGLHYSNTRSLVDSGWGGAFIEMNPNRYAELLSNCNGHDNCFPILGKVGEGESCLGKVLEVNGLGWMKDAIDLVSIDIDGLDWKIFEDCGVRSRVFIVEVNGGHSPSSVLEISRDIAANNVGQPLRVFCKIAESMGLALVAYTGNAIFVNRMEAERFGIQIVTPEEAYEEYIGNLAKADKMWIFLVNKALKPPYFRFRNDRLNKRSLGLSMFDVIKALRIIRIRELVRIFRS